MRAKLRWLLITFHTYGLAGVVQRTRPRRARYGRAVRDTIWAGAHRLHGAVGDGIPAMELVAQLRRERMA